MRNLESKNKKEKSMSTAVISGITLLIPLVLGIIGIALFSAKKKEE
jgi:hypothetical protein